MSWARRSRCLLLRPASIVIDRLSSMLRQSLLISALALTCGAFALDDAKIVNRLEEKAKAVSEKIVELAKAGKLPSTDEGVELLKRLVDELAEVRRELRETKTRLDGVEAKVKEPAAKTKPSTQDLGKLTLS